MNQICLSQNSIEGDGAQEPLISVVIPVYNVEDYLCECLDSVVKQTYAYLEIIIVDDGANDFSGNICDEYASQDSRIRVIHQSNHGLGYARNVGLRKATGKYIIFLDSDDYWQLNTLEGLLREAEKNCLQVVVFAAKSFCDGIAKYKGPAYSHTCQNGVVKSGVESLVFARSHGEYYAQACLRLYRLDYLMSNGFQFDEEIIHEDESFSFLAYIHADRVMCLGERYYMRRYRPGSIMMNRNPVQSARGYRTAIETLMRYMQNRELSPLEQRLYCKQIEGYIFAIYSLYKESKDKKADCTVSVADLEPESIVADTQRTIKSVCRSVKGIPLHHRLILYNFYVGYGAWVMRLKAHRIRGRIYDRD